MSRRLLVLAPLAAGAMALVGVAFAVDTGADVGTSTPVVDDGAASTTVDDATGTTSPAGDVSLGASGAPTAALTPSCTVDRVVREGVEADDVECVERFLAAVGYLPVESVDTRFDVGTAEAVERFQAGADLDVDGVVGPRTAAAMQLWDDAETPFPPDPSTCPTAGRGAVVDRLNQRAWLCGDGAITREFPITTAANQPDPGTYPVYAKDLNAASTISGAYSEMTHFVAFTRGKFQGARIAFHSVPTYPDGSYVQPLDSVGTAEMFGASSGCIRVLPDDAVAIWDWLSLDDQVVVIN